MKIFRQLLIVSTLISLNAYAVPELHFNYLTVIVEQGKQIYANGAMQSKVRIDYNLKEGVSLTSLMLKEYETGLSLEEAGWVVSDDENEFDHNLDSIGATASSNLYNDPILKFRPVDSRTKAEYMYQYLSTSKSNTYLTICVEATTQKEETVKNHSTCYDPGIYRGHAIIFAHAALRYFSTDFTVTDKIEVALKLDGDYQQYDKYQLFAYTHSLVTNSSTSRSKRFKVLNKKILTGSDFGSGQHNESAYQYRKVYPPSGEVKKTPEPYIGYSGYYLYQLENDDQEAVDSLYFKYLKWSNKRLDTFPVRSYTPDAIVNILRVDYYNNKFMYIIKLDDYINIDTECKWMHIPHWEKDGFRCFDLRQSHQGDYFSRDASIVRDFKDILFIGFQLQDNYGHEFTYFWDVYQDVSP